MITSLLQKILPRRQIEGISALLLPFFEDGSIDFESFSAHLERTFRAGLTPAVNMDTGYINLINQDERVQVLKLTSEIADGRSYVAGAFIEGEEGDLMALYGREIDAIQKYGGTPILFQCSAMKSMSPDALVALYRKAASGCERMLAFELGEMFAPFGQIYDIRVVQGIMEIPQITGIKHSSLRRDLEWERLALRERTRPDFKIYTGNDLGIDMVMYGSDYLLGLSTFAPDYFAIRDAYWLGGDPRFYELNDTLQYLGSFAFRAPTVAYKHSAAQFLKLRGWISSDTPHPDGAQRPESDVEVLKEILARLEAP